MCGRFSIAVRISYLAERFGISEPAGISLPMYNVSPGEEVPVITGSGNLQCTVMQWGLVPSWAKRDKQAVAPINARAEGLADNLLFRNLLSHGRCIIPATGFYEWKQSGDQKYPWYFRMKNNELFGIAGLCDSRELPDGGVAWSFAIITTSPNSLVIPIHNRMPAILHQKDEKNWLDPGYDISNMPASQLTPYPPDNMKAFRVTKKVNSPFFKSETAVQEEIPIQDHNLSMWGQG
jgi:putative SOS response-associated peptidase YedK